MNPKFDLTLQPFFRVKGQEWAQVPGLLALKPPRRFARGRDGDNLVLYLTLSGNAPLSAEEYNRTTAELAKRFYSTPGSLTSAIRNTAEAFNQSLVDRNLKSAGSNQYMIGRLMLGVWRDAQFLIAQCGPTHAFHIHNAEARQIHDPQISGRGLGIGQTTPIYYSQVDLAAGDQIVLCADLPAGWDEALLHERFVSADALSQKLLSLAGGENLNAVMIKVQPGKGQLNTLMALPAPSRPVRPGVPVSTAQPSGTPSRPTSQIHNEAPAGRFNRLLSGVESRPQAYSPSALPTPAVKDKPAEPPAEQTPLPAVESAPSSSDEPLTVATAPVAPAAFSVPRRKGTGALNPNDGLPEIKRPSARRQGFFRGIATFLQSIGHFFGRIKQGLDKFLPSLLPASGEPGSGLSGSSLAFFAVAIPLVVVTVAVLVYSRYGRQTQYQEYYNQALTQAAQAHSQADLADVRHAWESTLYYLDQADQYGVTQDSSNLRQEAQAALDNLDSIIRLNFQPAIVGGLDRSVQVTRMAATTGDLYLLNATNGSVIRAVLGSQGYEVDASFACGPGTYGSIIVGSLIDIKALQMSNNYNARVVGIDSSGNLLYCGFNIEPQASTLSVPPLGWQKISAFSLDTDGNNLYVLDPQANDIWVYQGSFGKFTGLPSVFFGEQVPQGMNTSIDIAANNSDIYLLFSDGHVASCPATHYVDNPLRCSDPVTFVDNRPQRTPGPQISDAIFNQMTFTTAPDPLLYMLEPLTRAVYYFSPRSSSLELRGQFRAGLGQAFTGSASAMTIAPNHYIFFSIGYQVYYATNAP